MTIEGRTTLLAFIDEQKRAQNLTDAELCRRAGIGSNIMGNLRSRRGSYPNVTTLIALINALGFDLTPTPMKDQP